MAFYYYDSKTGYRGSQPYQIPSKPGFFQKMFGFNQLSSYGGDEDHVELNLGNSADRSRGQGGPTSGSRANQYNLPTGSDNDLGEMITDVHSRGSPSIAHQPGRSTNGYGNYGDNSSSDNSPRSPAYGHANPHHRQSNQQQHRNYLNDNNEDTSLDGLIELNFNVMHSNGNSGVNRNNRSYQARPAKGNSYSRNNRDVIFSEPEDLII